MPQEFPPVSADLIKALDVIFPDKLPMLRRIGEKNIPSYDLRDIDHASGSRAVINRLRMEYNRQNGIPLVNPVE